MATNIANYPLTCKVRISGSSFDNLLGSELQDAQVKLALNERADTFDIKIWNFKDDFDKTQTAYANMSLWSKTYDVENTVEIWRGGIDGRFNIINMHFDENHGNYTYGDDSSRTTGSLSGDYVWTTGKYGWALDFANYGYIDITAPVTIPSGSSDFTMDGWFNLGLPYRATGSAMNFRGTGNSYVSGSGVTGLNSGSMSVEIWLQKKYSESTGSYTWQHVWSVMNGRTYNLYWGTASRTYSLLYNVTGSEAGIAVRANVSDDNWHHIVSTWDSNYSRAYFDGIITASGSKPWALNGSDQEYCVGTVDRAEGNQWSGSVSLFKIYNRPLSDEEVSEHYNGICKNENGLIVYLDFQGDTKDHSGLGNHAYSLVPATDVYVEGGPFCKSFIVSYGDDIVGSGSQLYILSTGSYFTGSGNVLPVHSYFSKDYTGSNLGNISGEWHHFGVVKETYARSLYLDGEVICRQEKNLCGNPIMESDTGSWVTTGWYCNLGAQISLSSEQVKYGNRSLKVVCDGKLNAEGANYFLYENLPAGTKLTTSIWVYVTGSQYFEFKLYDTATGTESYSQNRTLATGWNYMAISGSTLSKNVDNSMKVTIRQGFMGATGSYFYIDGAQTTISSADLEFTKFTGSSIGSNTSMNIARDALSNNYYFDGVIDDIQIHNKALTSNEIEMRYTYGPQSKLIDGKVLRKNISRPGPGENYLNLGGQDYTARCLQRIVIDNFNDMEVSKIINYLIGQYAPEIGTGSVDITTVTVQEIQFPYISLHECLKQLSELAGNWGWYVDAFKQLHFFERCTSQSKTSFVTDVNMSEFDLETDMSETRNVVYTIGGVELLEDIVQEDISEQGYKLPTYWIATPFRPQNPSLKQISLYLRKTGSPDGNLQGEIRDGVYSGSTGSKAIVISRLTWKQELIAGGTGSWYPIPVNLLDTPSGPYVMDTTRTYYLVLKPTGVGTDANTYVWPRDVASGSGTFYLSLDGDAWGDHTSGSEYAMKTYYGVNVITESTNEDSITFLGGNPQGRRETVIKDSKIISRETARAIGDAKVSELSRVKARGTAKVYLPDVCLYPGDITYFTDLYSGIDTIQFEISDITYDIKPIFETYSISLSMGTLYNLTSNSYYDLVAKSAPEAPKSLPEIIYELREEIKRLKVQASDSGDILDLARSTKAEIYSDTLLSYEDNRVGSFVAEAYDIEDAFTATGSNWISLSGNWGILSNKLSGSNLTTQGIIRSSDSKGSNVVFLVKSFPVENTGSSPGQLIETLFPTPAGWYDVWQISAMFQSFHVTETVNIESATFALKKLGSPSGPMTAAIYNTGSSVVYWEPLGDPICVSASRDANEVTGEHPGPYTLIEFTFISGSTLTPDKWYCITLRMPPTGSSVINEENLLYSGVYTEDVGTAEGWGGYYNSYGWTSGYTSDYQVVSYISGSTFRRDETYRTTLWNITGSPCNTSFMYFCNESCTQGYEARITGSYSGLYATLSLIRWSGGSGTTLATVDKAVPWTNGSAYWLDVKITGSTHRVRLWETGSECYLWQIVYEDDMFVSGSCGYKVSGSYALFDDFKEWTNPIKRTGFWE